MIKQNAECVERSMCSNCFGDSDMLSKVPGMCDTRYQGIVKVEEESGSEYMKVTVREYGPRVSPCSLRLSMDKGTACFNVQTKPSRDRPLQYRLDWTRHSTAQHEAGERGLA